MRLFSQKSKPFMHGLLFNRYWLPRASTVANDWSKSNTPGSPAQPRPQPPLHMLFCRNMTWTLLDAHDQNHNVVLYFFCQINISI